MTEKMIPLTDFYIDESPNRGNGVFACKFLEKDSVFYLPYTKILRKAIAKNNPLTNYVFPLNSQYRVMMGEFGSFINHRTDANVVVEYTLPEVGDYQKFRLIKDVNENEEIFMYYGKWAEREFGE